MSTSRHTSKALRPSVQPSRSKGTGSIDQLESGRYRPRLTHAGKRVVFTPSLYETFEEAELAIKEYLHDVQDGGSARQRRELAEQTLNAAVARHIRDRAIAGVSAATLSDLQDLARNVVDHRTHGIGHLRLIDLRRAHGQTWLKAAEAAGQGASRRVKALGLVHGILQRAREDEWLATNPFAGVHAVPPGQKSAALKKDKFFLRPEELVALSVHSPARMHARLVMELHLWSGMRPGEIRAMDGITAVPDYPGTLFVEHHLDEKQAITGQGPTKNRQSRDVQIPTPLWQRVVDLSQAQGRVPGLPLFPASRGGWWLYGVWSRQAWQPALTAAQHDHPTLRGDPTTPIVGRRRAPTPYAMRATFVSLLQAAGIDQPTVQAQVGHSTGSFVTDVYSMPQNRRRVRWPQADAIRGTGLGLQESLDALYEMVWRDHAPAAPVR